MQTRKFLISARKQRRALKPNPFSNHPTLVASDTKNYMHSFQCNEKISVFYRGMTDISALQQFLCSDFLDAFPRPLQWVRIALSVYPIKGTFLISHNGAYLLPGWFRTVNIAVDGSIGVESASQLSVPPARVPAEAGADAHHGDDDDHDQSQRVPHVVRLHRADEGEKDEPHDCCGIWKFGSHVAAVSSSGSAASESDDAKGERTSGSAQPITEQLYSSRACRMFSFSSYKQA